LLHLIPDLTKKDRLTYAKEQMLSTFKKVVSVGKVLKSSEIIEILQKQRGK
jgi:hypothetical protein